MAVNLPHDRIGAKGLIPDGLGKGTAKSVYEFMAHLLRIQIYTEASVKMILLDSRLRGSDMLTQGA